MLMVRCRKQDRHTCMMCSWATALNTESAWWAASLSPPSFARATFAKRSGTWSSWQLIAEAAASTTTHLQQVYLQCHLQPTIWS